MISILQDIRYALRQLRKTPGFTVTAVLTLALGIGANTAIFTLVNSILLAKLPVKDPGQLVRIGDGNHCCFQGGFQDNDDYSLFSYDAYKNMRDHAPEFEQLAAVEAQHGIGGVTARRASGDTTTHSSIPEFVSGNYFQTLGVQPYAGRFLGPADDQEGAPIAAVLNYTTWQRDYAADPSILGSTVILNTHPVTIVGIAPKGFYGDRISEVSTDFFVPISSEPTLGFFNARNKPDINWLWVIGRVKSGTQLDPLQAKLSGLLRQSFAANVPLFQKQAAKQHLDQSHVVLTPGAAGADQMQKGVQKGLYLLMAIAGLVLLIACANIANLILARGMARRTEISVRVALGAMRTRLIRQMLTESITLSCIGGIAGLAIAYLGTGLLLRLVFPDASTFPSFAIHPTPSLIVLGFAFAVSLLTGILFGLAPAWIASQTAPGEALRGANRATGGASLLQRGLVVVQAALSLVLLMGAGLLGKSLSQLEHQNFGLQTANRVVVNILPLKAGYKAYQLSGLYDRINDTFHAMPGVEHVGLATYMPLSGDNWGESVYIQGQPHKDLEDTGAAFDNISAEFMDTVGQHVLLGRGLLATDTSTSPGVALVNQAFVKKFFKHGEDPLGQHFGPNDAKYAGDFEIVGVVEDSRYVNTRDKTSPMFFLPLVQAGRRDKDMAVSANANALVLQVKAITPGLEQQIRHTIASIDPNLTVDYYQTFASQVAGQFNQDRMLARLTLLFGALALALAALGLYGVTAYSVQRRTNEIGIRMALGAERSSVIAMIMRGALLQTAIGLALGIPAALLCVRYVQSQLYQTNSWDLAVLLTATATLAVAACIAGLIPARRAASLDPARTLRTE